jgi:hypothetical protein
MFARGPKIPLYRTRCWCGGGNRPAAARMLIKAGAKVSGTSLLSDAAG